MSREQATPSRRAVLRGGALSGARAARAGRFPARRRCARRADNAGPRRRGRPRGAGRTGLVTVTAEHPSLGHATVRLTVTPAFGRTFL